MASKSPGGAKDPALQSFVGIELGRAHCRWRVSSIALSVVRKLGSHFHHGRVSPGPPMIPDSRFSRVRFEALAFLGNLPRVVRMKTHWPCYSPSPFGLLPDSACSRVHGILRSEPEHVLVATGRQRPEPLCLTTVLPPPECRFPSLRRALPLRPRSYGLMRQSVRALSSLDFISVRESLQVAANPCCAPDLPDVISADLSLDAWALHRGGVPGASPVVFPGTLRPSPKGEWVGCPQIPPSDFPTGPISRLSPFHTTFRPPSLLATPVAPTAALYAGQP